jgi:hypothetical protein
MKKDIEFPVVKDVYVAIVREWNKEFESYDWNAYLINNGKSPIEMVFVVSKGYNAQKETSKMRHGIGVVAARDYAKIELLQEEVLQLNNEFAVTYFLDNKLFEKTFLFKANTVHKDKLGKLPVLSFEGVLGS